MKKIMIVLAAVIAMTGCKETVSETTVVETVTVTKFVKRTKGQRISLVSKSGIVFDNAYVSKHCSGCYATVGDQFRLSIRTIKYDDGSSYTFFNSNEVKSFLRAE